MSDNFRCVSVGTVPKIFGWLGQVLKPARPAHLRVSATFFWRLKLGITPIQSILQPCCILDRQQVQRAGRAAGLCGLHGFCARRAGLPLLRALRQMSTPSDDRFGQESACSICAGIHSESGAQGLEHPGNHFSIVFQDGLGDDSDDS